ncbi:hypothetical protein Taro_028564 [Colocasia esculenta]|uniref:Uncharacterized protein n=1 Tax=Colocasia esculenta TaxID=4460 RepID=A0A843VNI2_COLES|nr:hypothetical protein [Colocasia esculenta]
MLYPVQGICSEASSADFGGFRLPADRAAWEPREDDARSVDVPSARRFWRASVSSAGNINDNLLKYEEEARVKQESFDLNPSDENRTAMGEANANLRRAMNHMEIFWAQKARMQWLEDGDKNTAFYHAVVRGNMRRNTISRLQVDGV